MASRHLLSLIRFDNVIVYTGSIEDAPELIQFFRRESDKLRALRRVVISPAHTRVLDINKDGVEFPRLSYGSEVLELLLRELGVVFNKQTLHAHPDAIKEFDISAAGPGGTTASCSLCCQARVAQELATRTTISFS